jgi:hypothetical protein
LWGNVGHPVPSKSLKIENPEDAAHCSAVEKSYNLNIKIQKMMVYVIEGGQTVIYAPWGHGVVIY